MRKVLIAVLIPCIFFSIAEAQAATAEEYDLSNLAEVQLSGAVVSPDHPGIALNTSEERYRHFQIILLMVVSRTDVWLEIFVVECEMFISMFVMQPIGIRLNGYGE